MRRLAFACLFLFCSLPLGSGAGSAQAASITLRIMLFGSHSDAEASHPSQQATVGRFQPDHGQPFILDRSNNPPLMRFEDSPEVWILQPQPGPRGDTIYRNDAGQPMLRATKLGGLTLFTADDPEGAAAAFDGDAPSLRPPPVMSPNALLVHVYQAYIHASRAAQRPIPFFTVDDATPETAALVAETAISAEQAITRVSHMVNGRTALAPLTRVLLARGHKPDAQLAGGALTVTYAPNNGIGERPSSERIVAVIISPGPMRMQVKEAGGH